MTDPFSWSINLGRWAGIPVRLHLVLIIFIAGELLGATLFDPKGEIDALESMAWMFLLLLALAFHEAGHAVAAMRLGVEPDPVRLWPLGNLVGPQPVPVARSGETFLVALAGPLSSFAIAVMMGIGLAFADAHMVLNPFGRGGIGDASPILANGDPAEPFQAVWWLGWFGYLNWVVFLANLIPAIPMDGGRMLRAALAGPALTSNKDGLIAPWTARAFAVVLAIVGVIRLLDQPKEGGIELILLAILFEIMVRAESRILEDGGYFEENLFGYDFSEGYTSLEGSGPKVRPYRENALARWRRRRSMARRQRLAAKEAAEERRMDEILAKIHTLGRDALSAEEQRFLIRVSTKYRNRTKARD